MKQLLEIVPVILFFIVYKMDGTELDIGGWHVQFDGIFTATKVMIAASVVYVIGIFLVEKKLEQRPLWMLLAISVFGGLTLFYRDETFIQWKPTVFNWGMAVVFAGSQFIGKKNLLERALGIQIELPKRVWRTLNLVWVLDFVVVGAMNLVVAFNFSEAAWVDYKLYSAIGFTLVLMVLTAVIISPHLAEDGEGKLIDPENNES